MLNNSCSWRPRKENAVYVLFRRFSFIYLFIYVWHIFHYSLLFGWEMNPRPLVLPVRAGNHTPMTFWMGPNLIWNFLTTQLRQDICMRHVQNGFNTAKITILHKWNKYYVSSLYTGTCDCQNGRVGIHMYARQLEVYIHLGIWDLMGLKKM